jgi:hypothetical protein
MQPENTADRDPIVHLVGAMSEGSEGYILGMEAAGQRQVVASDVMPLDNRDRDAMVALGFTFGEPVDDLFQSATLPEGWSRQGSDHAMWSHIVDERGIERVGIFYKAAFYDRSAHASLTNVGYSLGRTFIYGDGPDETPWGVLTEDERAQFIAALTQYGEDAAQHPDIYNRDGRGDRAAKRLRELCPESGDSVPRVVTDTETE